MEFKHKPVLLDEVIEGLNIQENGIYIDCTMGGGGHSSVIAQSLSEKGKLIGFDRDIDAVNVCSQKFAKDKRVTIIHSNYKDAPEKLTAMGINEFDGLLIDLGVSSYQLDNGERGFSFNNDGPLDMRMDTSQELDAYYVVNNYAPERLIQILYRYGEEDNAKRIVQKICEYRKDKPIETTKQLKEIIESAFPKKVIYGKGGVSKKTFQAIRIEVNDELDGLDKTVETLAGMLKKGGRMAVITFHSLEDRIVKNVFKDLSTGCVCPPKIPVCICGHKASVKLVNRKPIIAGENELNDNSRASSAKLRVIEKL
ncbi:MAG: 16S rRNA (cytosine(1402)-N(4))-methyltransferase RsmH [Clostridiales bacterium]|nr:16S rRNA (cytosine(1402)-N(4))-methyltransferase RsmH [Clostridiales bacterium]